jgi:hypothetical protein
MGDRADAGRKIKACAQPQQKNDGAETGDRRDPRGREQDDAQTDTGCNDKCAVLKPAGQIAGA